MGVILTEASEFVSVEDLVESQESLEKNKKQQEYVEYIEEHIGNVKKAFEQYFKPLLAADTIGSRFISDEEFKDAIIKAEPNIEVHDSSKWGDEEFDGYREKYYPTAKELSDPEYQEKVKERAEIAWISHYKHNWHHPMYWVDEETGEPTDMNLQAIVEMICDWLAMSMKYGNTVSGWYESDAEKEKAAMTDRTKQITEELIYNILHC